MFDDPECKAGIIARLRSLQPDAARHWGKMTAPQMICHLNDSFLGMVGSKPAKALRFSLWRLTKGIALSGGCNGRTGWRHVPSSNRALVERRQSLRPTCALFWRPSRNSHNIRARSSLPLPHSPATACSGCH